MKRFLFLALCALFACQTEARTFYVNAKRPNNKGNGLSAKKAKKTLQAAINIAKKGDTILVYPGTYAPIQTKNKKIAIKSVKGSAKTKISASAATSTLVDSIVVDLSKTNLKTCEHNGTSTKLTGFLIDGTERVHLAVLCGCVTVCTIQGCESAGSGGHFSRCLVRNNRCDNYLNLSPLFSVCKVSTTTISANGRDSNDNALCLADNSSFVNCSFTGNSFIGGSRDTSFVNCLIADNSFAYSGFADSSFLNCTIAKNVLAVECWGDLTMEITFFENSKFHNCILWKNYSQRVWSEYKKTEQYGEYEEYGYYDGTGTWHVCSYNDHDLGYDEEDHAETCGYWDEEEWEWILYTHQTRTVTGLHWTGEYVERADKKQLHNVDAGNVYKNTDKTNKNPKFVNAAKGDYRLKKKSPFVDKGKLTKAQKKLVGTKDLGGGKRIRGKAIDRGCHEY